MRQLFIIEVFAVKYQVLNQQFLSDFQFYLPVMQPASESNLLVHLIVQFLISP